MEPEKKETILLQMRNLRMKLGQQANDSLIQLLCDTIWGTPGGMRYQHFNTPDKIPLLHCPWFLSMEKDEETIAALCLDQRQLDGMEAFYIRYFSFSEGLRRKGVAAREEAEGNTSKGQGLFKRASSNFFGEPKELFAAAGVTGAIFYAYVELENARSRDMVAQMGLVPCGQFNTHIFSRVFTRTRPEVRRARPEEHAQLLAHVRATYADHAFFHDLGLFQHDDFFVLEKEGRIVAGCQSHQVHWRIVELPGRTGRILMHTLPYIPLLSRLFNPRRFEFSAIEGLFCLPGEESSLQTLLEGVLALQGRHTALIWLATNSPMARRIQDYVRMGPLQRLQKNVPATVVMRPYGISEEQRAALQGRPVYISAWDST